MEVGFGFVPAVPAEHLCLAPFVVHDDGGGGDGTVRLVEDDGFISAGEGAAAVIVAGEVAGPIDVGVVRRTTGDEDETNEYCGEGCFHGFLLLVWVTFHYRHRPIKSDFG